MRHLYRAGVVEAFHPENGVRCYLDEGTEYFVDGRRYALRVGGSLTPAGDDWHHTEEAAWKAAVPALEALRARIDAQLQRWREGRR